MSYLSVIISFILVNFHSAREAAEETLDHGWERNRDLQIPDPAHRNLGEETEGSRDKHIGFLQTTHPTVSPVSSFSTVSRRHKVIPSWSGGTLFKLWCVMRCQAVERHGPLVFCMASILYFLPCSNSGFWSHHRLEKHAAAHQSSIPEVFSLAWVAAESICCIC